MQPVFPIALLMVHNTRMKNRIPFSPIFKKGRRADSGRLDLAQYNIHCPHPLAAATEKNKHATKSYEYGYYGEYYIHHFYLAE